jgi:hypothetical protein
MKRGDRRSGMVLVAVLWPIALLSALAQRYLGVRPWRVASVDLDARLISGNASAARAVIVVLPQDSQPYRVLIWIAAKSSIVRPTTRG